MDQNRSPAAFAQTLQPLVCPHCNAGSDQTVVGLCWDREEASWRCLLCGYRLFERPRRSEAQIAADRLWEHMFASVDDEDGKPREGEEEPDDDLAALPPKAASACGADGHRGAVNSRGPVGV